MPNAGMLSAKQLAYENANTACQAAVIRPYRKAGTITDCIRLCSDIGPTYVQGMAMALALQEKTVQQVLLQKTGKGKRRINGPPGSCFVCGQIGYQGRSCPNRTKENSNERKTGALS